MRSATWGFLLPSRQKNQNKGLNDKNKLGIIGWLLTLTPKAWTKKFQGLGVSGSGNNRQKGALAQFVEKAESGEFPPKHLLSC